MGVRITPAAVDLVTAVESREDYRAAAETVAVAGAAFAAPRVVEVPRLGELAVAALALRPRSLGERRDCPGVEERPV